MSITDYKTVAGQPALDEITRLGQTLRGKRVALVNSTRKGGGVAEILRALVPLLHAAGVQAEWIAIEGDLPFFRATKQLHNSLQGEARAPSKAQWRHYLATNQAFSAGHPFSHDLVVVHDPQPMAAIASPRRQPWIWRCHIDITRPNPRAWRDIKPYLEQYDEMIVSSPVYRKRLNIRQTVIRPAIDPLSAKNRPMDSTEAVTVLTKLGIDTAKPILAQIARYDKWKDPEGAVKVFKRVRKKIDCQLVLMGNAADDDPESMAIYQRLRRRHGGQKDITLLMNVPDNDRVVNALQRTAAVILQKSIREGFALTVSEALYKETPVVASRVGGIPLQITDGRQGYLCRPHDHRCFANRCLRLMQDPSLRKKLGQRGKQRVIGHFLITRLAHDWLNVFARHLA